MRLLSLGAALFLIGSMVGCGNGEGEVLPAVNDSCPETGMKTCGLDEAERSAVLVCSKTPRIWMVGEVCATRCVFNGLMGAICESSNDDAGGGDVPAATDVVLPEDVPDVKELEELRGGDMVDAEEPPEVIFKDLMPDMTPPWVEATIPADGAMGVSVPFTIQITFTEPLHAVTVAESTVKLFDVTDDQIPVEIEWLDEKKTVVKLTPAGPVFNSSPYRVTLDPMIKDLAGNMMGNSYQFTFYTAAIPTLATYKTLAGKYAPLLYQATNSESPQYDYLTRFDFDGDWVAENNVGSIKNMSAAIESQAYYSVTETKSHFFITYSFFYPYRFAEEEDDRFGNDVSGALVVVRKIDEAPLAVETYFKKDNDERSFSFLTEESGLITAGKTFTDFHFDGLYPAATLFPDGRYVGYLSSRKHESCLWLNENNGPLDGCFLNTGVKNSMQKIEYVFKDGTVDALKKEGGKYPQAKESVGYGLIHLLDSWWVRRTDVDQAQMWASEYTYVPHNKMIYQDRPELSHPVPSVFVDPENTDNGRPPWAWKYNPLIGTTVYNIERGVWFLDPAVHFKQRHDQSNVEWEDFDAQAGTGWSLEYCFNPYFSLDYRDIWDECTALP